MAVSLKIQTKATLAETGLFHLESLHCQFQHWWYTHYHPFRISLDRFFLVQVTEGLGNFIALTEHGKQILFSCETLSRGNHGFMYK